VDTRPSAPVEPPPFCLALRHHVGGFWLIGFRQVSGDRVVELTFSERPPEQPPEQPPEHEVGNRQPGPDPSHRILVHELFGHKPNFILLDGERRILTALQSPRRAGEAQKRGAVYEFPRAPQRIAPSDEGSQPTVPSGSGARFPLSTLIAERYQIASQEKALTLERTTLVRSLERQLKRRRALQAKIDADLKRASERGRDRELGELLKGAYPELRQGLERIEVVDYFSPDMKRVAIALDPRLTPQKNVERYFKRYRKAERAVSFLSARSKAVLREAEELTSLLEMARGEEDLANLEKIKARASPLVRKAAGRKEKRGRQVSSGPRRFVSADGYVILVGRSARENDQLTLRTARGNDLFLHVAGRAGAHVIVRTEPGKELPQETLYDAGQLALYYSLPHRSSGVLAQRARGDVDFTPVKHVRKPKGANPGAVLLATHKTLRVELDEARLGRLLGSLAALGDE